MILKIPVLPESGIMDENIKRIISEIEKSDDIDLLLFNEGFIQGFDSISFEYKEDVDMTLFQNSKEIVSIKQAMANRDLALGFGYYENHKGGIYSSYMVIGTGGEEGFNYRALSSNWKNEKACADYREGERLYSYGLKGKEIGIVMGEDFIDEGLLPQLVEMDAKVDLFYWSYPMDFEDCSIVEEDYLKVSQILDKPILFSSLANKGKKGKFQILLHGKIIKEDLVELGESYLFGL